MRRALAVFLSGLLVLVVPSAPAAAAEPTTGTIEGVVLDQDRPVPGTVVCLPYIDGCSTTQTTTGVDGRFRLELVPGSYRLYFMSPGFGLRDYYPEDSSATLTVTAGAVTSVIKSFGPHGAMEGRVLTNSGAPAAGAVIGFLAYRHNMYATTDADGYYKLDFLPELTSPVFAAKQWSAPFQYVPRKKSSDEGTPVTITIGETAHVDERLLPLGTITGTFSGPGGGVPAWVSAGGTQVDAADGSYEFLLWPGDYKLHYEPQSVPFQPQYATGTLAEQDATVFHVEEDQVVRHDEKMIDQGAIGGRVVDHAGAPIANQSVQLLDGYGTSQANIYTDSDGNWSMTTMAIGTYRIRYQNNFRSMVDGPYTVRAGQTTTVRAKFPLGGSAEVTATLDGKLLTEFCATLRYTQNDVSENQFECTETGTVKLADLSPYTFDVGIGTYTQDYENLTTVTAIAGKTVKVRVSLPPATS